ncbi:MAG: hypothetical protein EA369_05885 [Bradymonadales bacterium]|nr:MAG: hypothetical protein EA369_05885 [Bradymonadales bacterium]
MSPNLSSWLSLFGSSVTLVCCALPAVLVTLGAGAAMVGLIGAFPQLIWFSEHKEIVFSISGALIALAGWAKWRARRLDCPTEPSLREHCATSNRWTPWVFWASVALYFVGFFFAFLAPRMFF